MSAPVKKYSIEYIFLKPESVNSKIKKSYLRGNQITLLMDSINGKKSISVTRRIDGSLEWCVGDKPIDFSALKTSHFSWLKRVLHEVKIKVSKSYRSSFNTKINLINNAFQEIHNEIKSRVVTSVAEISPSEKNSQKSSEDHDLIAKNALMASLVVKVESLEYQVSVLEMTLKMDQDNIDQASLQKKNADRTLFLVNTLREKFLKNWFGSTFLDVEDYLLIDELALLLNKASGELSSQASIEEIYKLLLEKKEDLSPLDDLIEQKKTDEAALHGLKLLTKEAKKAVLALQNEIDLVLVEEASSTLSEISEVNNDEEVALNEAVFWANNYDLTPEEREFYLTLTLEEKKLYRIISRPSEGSENLCRIADLLISFVKGRNLSFEALKGDQYEINILPGKGELKFGEEVQFFGNSLPIQLANQTVIKYENNQWIILQGGPIIESRGISIDLTDTVFKLKEKRILLEVRKIPKTKTLKDNASLKVGLSVLRNTGIASSIALSPDFINWG